MDRNTPRPQPVFTREELNFLQDLLDGERAGWFNYYMETLDDEFLTEGQENAHNRYQLAKTLRDKVYHLGGRDTLALNPDNNQQRHWDQRHDY